MLWMAERPGHIPSRRDRAVYCKLIIHHGTRVSTNP